MDLTSARYAVKECEAFKGFEEAQLGLLVMNGQDRQFPEGAIIYEKGDMAYGAFFLIVSGKVNVNSEQNQILETIGPNEIIGEVGTISPQNKRTITVKAVEAVEWEFKTIEEKLPDLYERLKDLAWKRVTNWY